MIKGIGVTQHYGSAQLKVGLTWHDGSAQLQGTTTCNREVKMFSHSPLSQIFPSYPGTQEQMKDKAVLAQVPPFRHGAEAQKSAHIITPNTIK